MTGIAGRGNGWEKPSVDAGHGRVELDSVLSLDL